MSRQMVTQDYQALLDAGPSAFCLCPEFDNWLGPVCSSLTWPGPARHCPDLGDLHSSIKTDVSSTTCLTALLQFCQSVCLLTGYLIHCGRLGDKWGTNLPSSIFLSLPYLFLQRMT